MAFSTGSLRPIVSAARQRAGEDGRVLLGWRLPSRASAPLAPDEGRNMTPGAFIQFLSLSLDGYNHKGSTRLGVAASSCLEQAAGSTGSTGGGTWSRLTKAARLGLPLQLFPPSTQFLVCVILPAKLHSVCRRHGREAALSGGRKKPILAFRHVRSVLRNVIQPPGVPASQTSSAQEKASRMRAFLVSRTTSVTSGSICIC